MIEKQLHITAVIPQELYVEREADRNLQSVVKRMSKPAYISVARQMGKSNLLIHTKYALEDLKNRVVFIDVTNEFKSSRDCFRYIIDQILDSNEDIPEFQSAAAQIRKNRLTPNENHTKEYQDELKIILKSYTGNLFIFLDEVDDLRKHSFSDDIFAQIRKNYFLRVTYPFLNRLTYVLSGVIDPEKLIKTKENSPFNIAIPIYLGDFTFEEFCTLASRSALKLEEEILAYVYDWLKGNPRMSYDVLSLLEDKFIDGKSIDTQLIDLTIQELYLTSFKTPPIDHIRDLIKYNTEVRKSLVKLKKGELKDISDDMINQFYLFGIISQKLDKKDIKIKNRVIEMGLSDEWLEKIEAEKKGYYHLGLEKINQEQFEEGILMLNQYLENNDGKYVSFALFQIGRAYHLLNKYETSNSFLLKFPVTKENSLDVYMVELSLVGLNFLRLGKYDDALRHYEEVLKDSNNPALRYEAHLNKGESIFNKGQFQQDNLIQHYNETLGLRNVLQVEEYGPQNTSDLALIHFRLAALHDKVDKNKTIEYLEKSLEFANSTEKVEILLTIDQALKQAEDKRVVYLRIYNHIIENKVNFSQGTPILGFHPPHAYLILLNLFDFGLTKEYEQLLHYAKEILFKHDVTVTLIEYSVAIFSINNGNIDTGIKILMRVIADQELNEITQLATYQILGILLANKNDDDYLIYLKKYFNLFEKSKNFDRELSKLDFDAFTTLIEYYRGLKDNKQAFNIAKVIESHISDSIENKLNSVLVLFFIMDLLISDGKVNDAKEYGNNILRILEEVEPKIHEFSYVDRKGLQNIKRQVSDYLKSLNKFRPIEPISIVREPGRNEFVKVRYKNGTTINVKYKKVASDIRSGECIIVPS